MRICSSVGKLAVAVNDFVSAGPMFMEIHTLTIGTPGSPLGPLRVIIIFVFLKPSTSRVLLDFLSLVIVVRADFDFDASSPKNHAKEQF